METRSLRSRQSVSIGEDTAVPIGLLQGLVVSRKDNDEVYIAGGSIEIGETLFNSNERLAIGVTDPLSYGSDVCTGGTPSHAVLFDNNTGGDFSQISEGQYYQYQLASGKTVNKLRMYSSGNADCNPAKFTLKVSNTGAFSGEEVTLLSVTSVPGWSVNEWKEWTFANTTSYTYYRVTVTEAQVPTTAVRLMEMEMQEGITTLSASTPYYIYVDPGSGTELAVGNFILSPDEPSFDSAKGGYYHPINTDQRTIAYFTTDGSGYVPTLIYMYQPVPVNLPTQFDPASPGTIGGTSPGVIYGWNKEIYKTQSADSPLTALQCSGTIVSNYGMTDADCTIDLPTAAEGLAFVAILPAVQAHFFKFHCPAAQADKIYLLGVAGSDDGNVGVASGYATGASASFFTFKASDGGFDWFCIPIFGTWVAS